MLPGKSFGICVPDLKWYLDCYIELVSTYKNVLKLKKSLNVSFNSITQSTLYILHTCKYACRKRYLTQKYHILIWPWTLNFIFRVGGGRNFAHFAFRIDRFRFQKSVVLHTWISVLAFINRLRTHTMIF